MREFIRAIEDETADMLLRGGALERGLAVCMITATAGAIISVVAFGLWLVGAIDGDLALKACVPGAAFGLLGVGLNWALERGVD